jgi:DNA-directed RNA polymerase specialized sigma24 family protein
MGFPETRVTLIERLAHDGSEEDWRRFLADYWGPVCRFSLRWGARDFDDAEDIAGSTFQAIVEQRLLGRWVDNRAARLRSVLCAVVRNLLSNRGRKRAGNEPTLAELPEVNLATQADLDAFYVAWVEDMVQQAVGALAKEYHESSRGDYVRVLYGRLCQGMSIAQVAEALELTPTTVDNYFRHSRSRLTEKLSALVRGQVARYTTAAEVEDEFTEEWERLGQYLATHGGLEDAVRSAYELYDPVRKRRQTAAAMSRTVTSLALSGAASRISGKNTGHHYENRG